MSAQDDLERPRRYVVVNGTPVSGRISSWLHHEFALNEARTRVRGRDRELDEVLHSLHWSAIQYEAEQDARRQISLERNPSGESSETTAVSDRRLTAAEAAARIGIGTRRVQQLVAAGELLAVRRSRRWEIDPASVDDYRTRRPA